MAFDEKMLEKFKTKFAKSYGEGRLQVATRALYTTCSTGSIALDKATVVGGLVFGRIIEMWGPPGGGKTSLSLLMIAEAQKFDERDAVFIDVEGTFDGTWAETLGVDLNRLLVVDPKTAEDVADMMKDFTASGLFSIVVLDSIGAMTANEEFEKDAEQVVVGTTAKIITRMLKISLHYAKLNKVSIVLINQVRAAIGAYGKDTDTGGGWKLKHVSSLRLNVKRGSAPYTVGTNDNKRNVGYEMVVRVEKNKFGPEGRVAKFGFFTETTKQYGPVGVDRVQEAFTVGKGTGAIKQGGAWYVLPDGSKYQGEKDVLAALRADPSLIDKIREISLATVADQIVDDELVVSLGD